MGRYCKSPLKGRLISGYFAKWIGFLGDRPYAFLESRLYSTLSLSRDLGTRSLFHSELMVPAEQTEGSAEVAATPAALQLSSQEQAEGWSHRRKSARSPWRSCGPAAASTNRSKGQGTLEGPIQRSNDQVDGSIR